MFPIGDQDLREAGPGILTIALTVINILVFIFQLTLGPQELEQFFQTFGAIPTQVTQGQNLISLLTSMFLHGGWWHLIFNMAYLLVFGDNVEHVLGELGFLAAYLGGGLIATAAHIIVNPNSQLPMIGASGAVATVLGAYVVMFPRSKVRVLVFAFIVFFITRITAIVFIGIWAVTQFFNGIASLGAESAETGGVAFWAHVGGFVVGLLIGLLYRNRARNLQFESA